MLFLLCKNNMIYNPGNFDTGLSICHKNCTYPCFLSIIAHIVKGGKIRRKTLNLPTWHEAISNAARYVCQRNTLCLPT